MGHRTAFSGRGGWGRFSLNIPRKPAAPHEQNRPQSTFDLEIPRFGDAQNRSGMLEKAMRVGAAAPASSMLAKQRVLVPYL